MRPTTDDHFRFSIYKFCFVVVQRALSFFSLDLSIFYFCFFGFCFVFRLVMVHALMCVYVRCVTILFFVVVVAYTLPIFLWRIAANVHTCFSSFFLHNFQQK